MDRKKQLEDSIALPNFLIVGAAKSGTTSLYAYLRQHPDVFMPRWKEPSFFIGDPFPPMHRVTKKESYKRIFESVETQLCIGEASTSYLYDEASPSLIKRELGKIKVLIVLRNPVSMAYSLYNHMVRREGERLPSFEDALAAESGRFGDINFRKRCYGWHANYYYSRRGMYCEQVKRYLDMFGQENVKISLFEDLVKDSLQVAKSTFSFLGLDDTFMPEIKVHNSGSGLIKVPRFWNDLGLWHQARSFVLSGNILLKIPHFVRNARRKASGSLNPETASRLTEVFYDDICRLEQLIGKDLSAWK